MFATFLPDLPVTRHRWTEQYLWAWSLRRPRGALAGCARRPRFTQRSVAESHRPSACRRSRWAASSDGTASGASCRRHGRRCGQRIARGLRPAPLQRHALGRGHRFGRRERLAAQERRSLGQSIVAHLHAGDAATDDGRRAPEPAAGCEKRPPHNWDTPSGRTGGGAMRRGRRRGRRIARPVRSPTSSASRPGLVIASPLRTPAVTATDDGRRALERPPGVRLREALKMLLD